MSTSASDGLSVFVQPAISGKGAQSTGLVVFGTPANLGMVNIPFSVFDDATPAPATYNGIVSVNVTSLSIPVLNSNVPPSELPVATVGSSYTGVITPALAGVTAPSSVKVNFSSGPNDWTASSPQPAMVNGISLAKDDSTGNVTVSGTPTAAGPIYFTVTYNDDSSDTLYETLFVSPNIPTAIVNQPYAQTIPVLGGAGNVTAFFTNSSFTGNMGTTESGIALSPNSTTATVGVSGMVPSQDPPSALYFVVQASSNGGTPITQDFTLNIDPTPVTFSGTLNYTLDVGTSTLPAASPITFTAGGRYWLLHVHHGDGSLLPHRHANPGFWPHI